MSLKIDRAELEIVIKNDTSRKRMRELEDDMRKMRKEMKKLDESSPEFKGKLADLKKAQSEYDALIDKIGLTGLSMKELRKRQQELNNIILQLPGNSPLYENYKKQLTQVNDRMKELKGTAGNTESSISKLANGFNKYFNMGISLIAGITGASMAFRSMAEDVAKLDDVYSDVMKTTGLTKDEVVDLNEEFKKMDTRTSREELNKLATEAGKIGRTGKKDIMDFVDAGNQIRVALGEDLGEDAIISVGKMVSVFEDSTKQLQGIGLKEQMLAVGSAINELGASSTAAEPYLVQFAGRMGGVSKQAKISMADILGFASSLDQDMQQVEMSATALQQFIMKLMADPAKFAKLAGIEVKAFTTLLNTDTNAAIKQVLRAMNEKGGFQALIPIFQEMGLDGARATGVLSSLAGSIDQVDEAQRIANKAMTDGVSISKEYGLKNDNLAARLDKVKKNFKETQLELGSKLNPLLLTSTNYLSYLTKGLIVLINHWSTVSKILIILVGYWAAYNGKMLLSNLLLREGIGLKIKDLVLKTKDAALLQVLIIREALHAAMIGKTTLATKAAAIAQVIWNNVIKANPLGFLLGLLTTVAAGIWLVTSRMREATQAEQSAINVKKKVAEQYDDQEAKIRMLIGVLNNEKIALNERKKALDELKRIVPGYHADLTNEGILINNNKNAIKDYLVELEKQIYLDAIKEEKTALIKKKRQQEFDLEKKRERASRPSYATSGLVTMSFTPDVNKLLGDIKETDIALSKLDAEFEKISNKKTKSTTGPKEGSKQQIDGVWCTYKDGKWVPDKIVVPGGGGGSTDKNKKEDPYEADLKVKELAYNKQLLAEKQKLAKWEQTEEVTNANMLVEKERFLNEKLQLEIKYGKDTTGTLTELAEMEIARNKKTLDEIDKQDEQAVKDREEFEKKVEGIIEKYGESKEEKLKSQKDLELSIAKEAYNKGIIDAMQYAEIMKNILESAQPDPEGWTEKASKVADGVNEIAGNASGAMQGFQNAEEKAIETKYQKQIDAARKAGDDTTAIEEKKNAELAEIRRKNADKNFIVTSASIVAQTASAAINSFNNASVWGGPIAGGIAAAAAVTFGLSQLAEANAAHKAAKEGYRSGGYTGDGPEDQPAGIVHRGEQVVTARGVRNPNVRKFLNVFRDAELNGTIGMLNTTQILERVRTETATGYKQGGYVSGDATKQAANDTAYMMAVLEQNSIVMAKLSKQIEDGIPAYSVISGNNGSYEQTRRYEKLIKNANR